MLNRLAAARESLTLAQRHVATLVADRVHSNSTESRQALNLAIAALIVAFDALRRAELIAVPREREEESLRLAERFRGLSSLN